MDSIDFKSDWPRMPRSADNQPEQLPGRPAAESTEYAVPPPPKKPRGAIVGGSIAVVLAAVAVGAFFWYSSSDTDRDTELPAYTNFSDSPSLGSTAGNRIVLAPPAQGMYLGQTEWNGNDTKNFEEAVGKKAAIKGELVTYGIESAGETPVTLDVERARSIWNDGYITYAGAYEAVAGGGFNVDFLLQGGYDDILHNLAEQYKEFGKPVIFGAAREPNGILGYYMGGFGPNGTEPGNYTRGDWNLNQFDPSQFSVPGNPDLFNGLGDDTYCDGLERMIAAHRYYYDFFVRREGINFFTFETMGWATDLPPSIRGDDIEPPIPGCNDFGTFLDLMDGYYDWVSINWYMTGEGVEAPMQEYFDVLEDTLTTIRSHAPGKPVLITEFGVSCGANKPEKVTAAFNKILTDFPEIKAFTHWVDIGHTSFTCGLLPNTPEALAAQRVIADNPNSFHSCAVFSDGSRAPGC